PQGKAAKGHSRTLLPDISPLARRRFDINRDHLAVVLVDEALGGALERGTGPRRQGGLVDRPLEQRADDQKNAPEAEHEHGREDSEDEARDAADEGEDSDPGQD